MRILGAILAATLSLAAIATPRDARAAYVLTFSEASGNVVASGSGTFNTNWMSLRYPSFSVAPGVDGWSPKAATGRAGKADVYSVSFGGPTPFGMLDCIDANSGTGDLAGFSLKDGALAVPAGFKSGQFLSGTSLYSGMSLASMKLTPGTYVYNFGFGANRDTFTVNIGAQPVPEPASLALLSVSLLGIVLARRRMG